jgi:ribosome maturation factor RimP
VTSRALAILDAFDAGAPRLVPVLEVAARGIGRELARTRDFH